MRQFLITTLFIMVYISSISAKNEISIIHTLAPKSSFLVSISEFKSLFLNFQNISIQDRKKLLNMTVDSIFQYFTQQEQLAHIDYIKKILMDENLLEQKRINGKAEYFFNNSNEKLNDYKEWIIGLGGSYIIGRNGDQIKIIPRKNIKEGDEGKEYEINDVLTVNISEIENISFLKKMLGDIFEAQRILSQINLLKKITDNDVNLITKFGGFVNAMSVGNDNRLVFINNFIQSFNNIDDLLTVIENFMNYDYFSDTIRRPEAKSFIIEIIDNLSFKSLSDKQISQILKLLDILFKEKEEDNAIELAVNDTGTLNTRHDIEYGDIPNAVLNVIFKIPTLEFQDEKIKKRITFKITSFLNELVYTKNIQYPEFSFPKILLQIDKSLTQEINSNIDFVINWIKDLIVLTKENQNLAETILYRIADINNTKTQELLKEIASNIDKKYSSEISKLASELIEKNQLNALFNKQDINKPLDNENGSIEMPLELFDTSLPQNKEVENTALDDAEISGEIEMPKEFLIDSVLLSSNSEQKESNTTKVLNNQQPNNNGKIYQTIGDDVLIETNPKVRTTYNLNKEQMNNKLQILFLRKMLMEWIEFGVSKKDILKAYLVLDDNEKSIYENAVNSILSKTINLKELSWKDLTREDFSELSKIYLRENISDDYLVNIVTKTYQYMGEIESTINSELTVGEETEFPYGKELKEKEKLFFDVFEKGNNDIEFKTFPSKSYLYQMFFSRHIPNERDETSLHRTFRRMMSKYDSKIPYVISLLFTYALGKDDTLLGYQIPDETHQNGYEKRIWEMRYKNPLTTYGNVLLMEFTSWRHNMSAGLMTFLINLSVVNPLLWHDLCEDIISLLEEYKINLYDYDLNGFEENLVNTEKGLKIAKFQKDLTKIPSGKKESVFTLITSNPKIYEKIADSIIHVTEKMVETSKNNKKLYALEVLRELYMAVLSKDNLTNLEQKAMELALKKIENASFTNHVKSEFNIKNDAIISASA